MRILALALVAHLGFLGVAAQGQEFWASTLTSMVAVFTTIPVVIAAVLGSLSVLLAALLGAIAAVVWPFRPTGYVGLLRDLFAISRPIVPAYYRYLGRIRSPVFWGLLIGAATSAVDLSMRISAATGSS